jgi:transposase
MQSTTIGIDLAKTVFQISIADQHRHIIKRQRMTRSQFQRFLLHTPPARLIMEGCASAHHWGRLAQSHGHQVKLLHAGYVRPYVRRNKTDAADADALVRADADPELKPIPVKPTHQQALQSLHRIRAQWQRTRVARINEARGLLAEFGVVLPRGTADIARRLHAVTDQLPDVLQLTFSELIAEISEIQDRLRHTDRKLKLIVTADAVGQRLLTISGVGPTISSAMLAGVSDIQVFKRGRAFASWLGLTPREYSSGATHKLGRISRRGDTYLRMLLIHGARAALLAAKRAHKRQAKLTALQQWALDLQLRVGHNKATVALANKMARIIWAVWIKEQTFDGDHATRYHG